MNFRRRFLPVLFVPGCIWLSGCASIPDRRGQVASDLERRTGHGLSQTNAGIVALPPNVSFTDGLSEEEAVSVALWNNALFQETLADLGLSRADLVQAGMLPNPTFSMLVPIGAKPIEVTAKYPIDILWLRPKRVASAKLDYERTAQRLVQGGLDLIRDTRVAFADLSLADDRLSLAEELLALNQQIAELAKARMRAGEGSEFEAGNADIDILQSREQVARVRQDTHIARERLRHLLGLGLSQWPERIAASPPPPRAGPSVDVCLTNALAARPDLRAAELGLQAAGDRIGLAYAEIFTLAAGVNAKDVGSGASAEFLPGPTVDLTVPILNQNQGGIAQAKARFEKAARQYYTVRDRIVLEVREAHTRLDQAQESHEQWRKNILPPLEESIRQAEKAFQGGNVSYLFVLETNRKLYDARLKDTVAAAEVRRATAELERSVGTRLEIARQDSNKTGNETP